MSTRTVWSKPEHTHRPFLSGLQSRLAIGCVDSVAFCNSVTEPATPTAKSDYLGCAITDPQAANTINTINDLFVGLNTEHRSTRHLQVPVDNRSIHNMDTETIPTLDAGVAMESKEDTEAFTMVKSKKTQKRKREQDGADMDTEAPVASKRPQFPPISSDKLKGADEMRKVAVPAHRYTP
ncbi:hypothetical protein F7725_023773 [Dissostichus mawsoni]|uniref:Uncharacterized protein n=1 Tax=Dissostichus mawsoni TaxID=36200 RepID=A0A7J5XXK4_DISMA|nr:hypothetical protein F7725_023773 [Dissostichus mawsoni]